jgi:hypothetical protein
MELFGLFTFKIKEMKWIIVLIIYLFSFMGSVLGQSLVSKDVGSYLRKEKRYHKNAAKVIKQILKENNKSLYIKDLNFFVIPTFKAKEMFWENGLDSLFLTLEIDEGILLSQILMFEQRNYLSGFTYCKFENCNIYLYSDSTDLFNKIHKASNLIVIEDNYNLIFNVENYPDFWFLLKDDKISIYSFLDENIYQDKIEMQSLLEEFIIRKSE